MKDSRNQVIGFNRKNCAVYECHDYTGNFDKNTIHCKKSMFFTGYKIWLLIIPFILTNGLTVSGAVFDRQINHSNKIPSNESVSNMTLIGESFNLENYCNDYSINFFKNNVDAYCAEKNDEYQTKLIENTEANQNSTQRKNKRSIIQKEQYRQSYNSFIHFDLSTYFDYGEITWIRDFHDCKEYIKIHN